jgi:hypothetical protein
VLPGHFTILDYAGNNFFLQGSDGSIGKSRAEETVLFLGKFTDSVQGNAKKARFEDVLKDKRWLGLTIVIAHNLEKKVLGSLSSILWHDHGEVGSFSSGILYPIP